MIGHPIRKTEIPTQKINTVLCNDCGNIISRPKNKSVLLSSSFFSYQDKEDEIKYLIYHRNNGFKSEIKAFKIADIQNRHIEFLNKYFDIILDSLIMILEKYLFELNRLEEVIEKHNFIKVLSLVEHCFEAIFKTDMLYEKENLIKVFNRRNEHTRYKNFIDKFYEDLKKALLERKGQIKEIILKKSANTTTSDETSPTSYKISVTHSKINRLKDQSPKVTYHYELSKLATKSDLINFELFSNVLKMKCADNQRVLDELNHMEDYFDDDIEYFTSLRLISNLIMED